MVFHTRVQLVGGADELYPLDTLATISPALHAREIAKYDDTPERRRLRDTVIPLIERRWTAVVFLSPVHPHAIWQTWRDITGRERPSLEFWAIPAHALPADTVVLDRTRTGVGDPIDPREVSRFSARTFRTRMRTTAANRTWLESLADSGRSGAWFHGIPHVLAPGPVPVRDATVIDWRDARRAHP